ncbi:MAG: lipoyl(octanoyl) transferase LipB [Anaerolineales bacterium]|nr:lipoyl(octanoyl) transferase LipB [Anaerolineales bacterium]
MNAVCQVRRLGRVPYAEAWELQKQLAAQRAAGAIPDTLLLLEHPHTYTFGRQGQAAHLLWDAAEQRARGLEVVWVDRGGDVTYHGPGQLVGYPILKLGTPSAADGRLPQGDYVGYVRKLEEMLIRVCARFGLAAGQIRGLTGVWIQPDVASRCPACPPAARLAASKIAAIGVKVDARGISQHGFALNVAPDMDYFNGIIGCGIRDHAAISLADLLGEPPPLEAVMDAITEQFGRVFDYEMTV